MHRFLNSKHCVFHCVYPSVSTVSVGQHFILIIAWQLAAKQMELVTVGDDMRWPYQTVINWKWETEIKIPSETGYISCWMGFWPVKNGLPCWKTDSRTVFHCPYQYSTDNLIQPVLPALHVYTIQITSNYSKSENILKHSLCYLWTV